MYQRLIKRGSAAANKESRGDNAAELVTVGALFPPHFRGTETGKAWVPVADVVWRYPPAFAPSLRQRRPLSMFCSLCWPAGYRKHDKQVWLPGMLKALQLRDRREQAARILPWTRRERHGQRQAAEEVRPPNLHEAAKPRRGRE